jgi:hypothetical protein
MKYQAINQHEQAASRAAIFFGLFFDPEEGGDMYLR